MKAVFTCGGTGGHIYPAIAVARVLFCERQSGLQDPVYRRGGRHGRPALVPREGFRLETLQISSYHAQPDARAPSGIIVSGCASPSAAHCKRRTASSRDFQPDVILGTGGYASYPMLHEGATPRHPHRPCTSPTPCRASTTKMVAR